MPTDVTLDNQVVWPNGRVYSTPKWPLRTGYFTPAKIPLGLVYPRPDAETAATARHRKYHSDFLYRIPVAFRGGAWPFKYEIISGPAGSSIGGYYTKDDVTYGVLSWSPSGATGTQTWVIQCTDSDGTIATSTHTASLDNSAFLFVDSNVATSGTGSISSPLKTWQDWYLNDHNNATYAGKILVLRAGTHVLYGASGVTPNVYNVQITASIKPNAFIEYPGETAILDCSQGKVLVENANDFYIDGVTYDDACQLVNNAHFFYITAENANRIMIFNARFTNFGPGLLGDDNTNGIFLAGTSAIKNYFCVKNCTFSGFTVPGNGGFIDFYDVSNVVIEGNHFSDSAVSLGVHAKASVAFVTMRNNTFAADMVGVNMAIGNGVAANETPHDTEMCWNSFQNSGTVATFRCSEGQRTPNLTYNTYVYRNTSKGGCPVIRYTAAEPYGIDANLIVATDNLTGWNMTLATVTEANTATLDLTAIDANLSPVSGVLRFRVGCEVK